MKGSRLTAPILLLSLVVAACSDGDSASTTVGITEPPEITTTTVAQTTTTGPGLCSDVFCIVYHIQPDAVWSDATPITASDFAFTYEQVTDPLTTVLADPGYSLITGYEILDDKTILFSFSEVHAAYRTLFPVVLPRHVMEGLPADQAVREALRTTSGPFVLEEQLEGDRIIVRRNRNYWPSADPLSGRPLGDVSEIHFVSLPSTRDTLAALANGDVHVINPRPLDWMIEEIGGMENVVLGLGPGEFWEHIDFNHDDPLLSQRWVREAISLGIDREGILDATVRTIDPHAKGLGNTVWMTNSASYVNHYRDRFDPVAAEEILADNFCEKGEDGIYSCQGRRMSFVWATTVGDEHRRIQFELAQETLATIGIELVGEFLTPSQLFSTETFFGGPRAWQLIGFSWKAGADPYLGNSSYYCSGTAPNGFGALNVNRYCNDEVDALVRSTTATLDQNERAAAYNTADAAYLEDLALIPLYQKPDLLAWMPDLKGPELNPTASTDLWNVGAWTGPESVVFALSADPGPLNPANPANDEAASVLAALFHGAFGIGPDMDFRPVLVESVELLAGESS